MLPDSEAVETLLAERDALHGYLNKLDEVNSSARELVRERLRNEYHGRLDDVLVQLRSHADILAAQLAEDRADLAEQVSRLENAEDALAEAELRHIVGEYDQAVFDQKRVSLDDDIARCQLDRDAAQERVDRFENIYNQVVSPVGITAAPVADSPAPFPEQADDSDQNSEPEELSAGVAGADERSADFDAIDQALSEALDEVEEADLAGSVDDFRAEPTVPEAFSNLSDIPPLGSPPPGAPSFSPNADIEHFDSLSGEANDLNSGSAVAKDKDFLFAGTIVAGTDDGAEDQEQVAEATRNRTQRCAECGAMNRPFEWYCEKCGAELTTG